MSETGTRRGLYASYLSPIASSFDRFVSRGITGRSAASRGRSRAESLGPEERRKALLRIEEVYAGARPFEDVDAFFGVPAGCDPELTKVSERRAGKATIDVLDARWTSRTTTYAKDPVLQERFAGTVENQRAAARLFLARGAKRPAAILVHGYRGGQYAVEERVWPTSWLLERGVDVALFVLPFHAIRSSPLAPPRFPGSDPRFTNEGFRQAVDDLRALVGFLTERGAPAVGAMGMSLGGYTASLLATVEARLAFLALMIPLASFADIALAAGRLVGTEAEQQEQYTLLENAHAVVSPFSRAPKLEADAVTVVAGKGDRITPLSHAEKLSRHFGTEPFVFPGGHLLQFGRSDGFRAIGRMLGRRGMFDAR